MLLIFQNTPPPTPALITALHPPGILWMSLIDWKLTLPKPFISISYHLMMWMLQPDMYCYQFLTLFGYYFLSDLPYLLLKT